MRELPPPLYGGEGQGQGGQAAALQGEQLPPGDPGLHAARRRLDEVGRHGRRVHLRRDLSRRVGAR
eukprot:scaffold118880_cov37-Phaeocystis_antarctica.AAC.1